MPHVQREWTVLRGSFRDDHLCDPALSRLTCMKLLRRVYHLDVVWPRHHAPMRFVHAVTDPDELTTAPHRPRGLPRLGPEPVGQLIRFAAN